MGRRRRGVLSRKERRPNVTANELGYDKTQRRMKADPNDPGSAAYKLGLSGKAMTAATVGGNMIEFVNTKGAPDDDSDLRVIPRAQHFSWTGDAITANSLVFRREAHSEEAISGYQTAMKAGHHAVVAAAYREADPPPFDCNYYIVFDAKRATSRPVSLVHAITHDPALSIHASHDPNWDVHERMMDLAAAIFFVARNEDVGELLQPNLSQLGDIAVSSSVMATAYAPPEGKGGPIVVARTHVLPTSTSMVAFSVPDTASAVSMLNRPGTDIGEETHQFPHYVDMAMLRTSDDTELHISALLAQMSFLHREAHEGQ